MSGSESQNMLEVGGARDGWNRKLENLNQHHLCLNFPQALTTESEKRGKKEHPM